MIHQTDVLAPGLANTKVSRGADPRVFLGKQPHAGTVCGHDFTCAVGGAIINDNELHIAQRLAEHAANCLRDIGFAIIRRDDD